MIYLLIKVCVNKGLIRIKSIFKTLKISYYNGKDKVCLRGGIGFESCPMHVKNICFILFLLLFIFLNEAHMHAYVVTLCVVRVIHD